MFWGKGQGASHWLVGGRVHKRLRPPTGGGTLCVRPPTVGATAHSRGDRQQVHKWLRPGPLSDLSSPI